MNATSTPEIGNCLTEKPVVSEDGIPQNVDTHTTFPMTSFPPIYTLLHRMCVKERICTKKGRADLHKKIAK